MTRWFTAAALLAGAVGCGKRDSLDRVPVAGAVVADGKPLPGALVRFVPLGATRGAGASAVTGPDGTFQLADDRGFAGGVALGEYRVAVNRPLRPDGSPLPPGTSDIEFPDARESMPRAVTSPDTSPMAYTVTGPTTNAVIEIPAELLRAKKAKGKADDGP